MHDHPTENETLLLLTREILKERPTSHHSIICTRQSEPLVVGQNSGFGVCGHSPVTKQDAPFD